MRWLYRLQTRLGLTGPEGAAAVGVLLALLGGTVAVHTQRAADPLPADVYAAADAAFIAAAADSAVGAEDAVSVARVAPEPSTEAQTDSSAAEIAEAAVERAAAPRRTGKPPPARTNINTASQADLQRLPRIGPALAARIVEHRRTHGPFRHPDRITDVRGIGEKTLEELRPWIFI